ncbi:MAG: hypothetical protein R3B40_16825 [Polyangiales bacterium]|nr:hypothetical protein [Sandaracinaceae bacterium]
MTTWWAALLISAQVLGCGGDDAPPVPTPPVIPAVPPVPAPGVPPATPQVPAAPTPAVPGAGGTATNANEPAPETTGVEVQVRSVQLYHPESRGTPMPPLVADTANERDWIRDEGFQIAMQVEATNVTDRLLFMPLFDSTIRIQGARGGRDCTPARDRDGHIMVGRRVSDGPGNVWREDSGEEYFWRPGERVRFTMRARCGSISLLEVQPQTISGAFHVVANSAYEMGPPVRVAVPVTLPGAAMIMQTVQLPDGTTGYASGNWVTYPERGVARRDHLASWGISAHTAQRGDLPAQTPPVNVTRNEWSMVSSELSMTHYTQAQIENKGERLVRLATTITINTAAIEARLQADVSSAQAALLSATSALEAARGTLATAQSGGDEGAISAAEDAVEGAERTVSSAERGVSDAQRAFERGLSSERSDMARLLSCDRLKLTTNRRDVTARNSRDARDACAALRDNGSATVVWEFQIDRYEVPVALTFSLGRDAQFVPIASQALSVFDIH